MKICADHWAKVREAIKARGLDHLGAKSGQEAMADAVTQLQGGETQYDPLMDCNNMIWGRGLELGGLYLMGQKEDGSEYCPICEALAHMEPALGETKEQQERYWIDGPADAALKCAREKGLVPNVQ